MTDPAPVEAIDRALAALTELANRGIEGATLGELASSLEVNKATLHRALATMKLRGFVAQDPSSGAYRVGPSVIELSEKLLSIESLAVILHPALVALSAETGELVHLGVLTGAQVLYIDKVEPDRSIRVWSAIGRTMPAVTTALGRSLLAFRGIRRDQLEGYAMGEDPERVWPHIKNARERGWSAEFGENEPGIACVAVPLLRSGAAVAAVSITAPLDRMTDERVEWLQGAIRRVLPGALPAGFSIPETKTQNRLK